MAGKQQLDPSPFISELLIKMEAATLFEPMTSYYDNKCLKCGNVRDIFILLYEKDIFILLYENNVYV